MNSLDSKPLWPLSVICLIAIFAKSGHGQETTIPRCQLVPLPEHQVSFQVDGIEQLRWHFGKQYPRPFFFPFNGPSGATLTRMGHPGAENHDHHRSIWLAHNKINGIDFWSDKTAAIIRQRHWYAYSDGDGEAIMATRLSWQHERIELLDQDIVAALMPMPENEHGLEIQLTMRSGTGLRRVQLDKTNFGFLAVRMAKSISAHFGGGKLANSEGREGEPAIFGKRARWMDYSGPVAARREGKRYQTVEGITYMDHPANPRYPTRWHVREDGWMGASFCMDEAFTIEAGKSLTLRYLLLAHRGGYDQRKFERVHRAFSGRPGFEILKSSRKHRQYEVRRIKR